MISVLAIVLLLSIVKATDLGTYFSPCDEFAANPEVQNGDYNGLGLGLGDNAYCASDDQPAISGYSVGRGGLIDVDEIAETTALVVLPGQSVRRVLYQLRAGVQVRDVVG